MGLLPSACTVLLSLRLLCLSGLLLLSTLQTRSQAQISLDGSLGPRGALTGPNYTISDNMGQIRGPNLFHSFGQFNLSRGESATFTGPNTINNILSRVTGGSPSSIDGTIKSKIPGANFYLINPMGVMFGPNATLDISGSFHVSTADFLRFSDGATFSAHVGQSSTLTVAPPAAFGFLGPTPAPITVNGSALEVSPGKTLAVVGGEVTIAGNAARPLTLNAPGGRIHLVSVASEGEVSAPPLGPALDVESGTMPRGGRLELSVGAQVKVSGQGQQAAGDIVVRAGTLRLTGAAQIDGTTTGPGPGGRVTVVAREVQLTEQSQIAVGTTQSKIDVGTTGDGPGGAIAIQAGTLQLTGAAEISAKSRTSGPAGGITVVARDILLTEGGAISVSTSDGPGGAIVIQTGTLQLTGSQQPTGQPARINSSTAGKGPGGHVTVVAREVQLTESGMIEARTTSDGPGGEIVIQTGTLRLTGQAQIDSSSELRNSSAPGGHVTVVARDVQLTERGSILAQTSSAGPGGEVVIQTGTLRLTGQAQISSGVSQTGKGGSGGSITVQASERVEMAGLDQDRLATDIDSNTSGRGDGGRVVISAPTVYVENGHIRAVTGGGSTGRGGVIEVRGDSVTLGGGSDISTATSGTGPGGPVTVMATEAIHIRGGTVGSPATNPSRGPSGQVSISAPVVSLEGAGSTIGASTSGPGQAGEIKIQAGTLRVTGTAQIDSTSFSAGRGGSITVTATEAVQLLDRGALVTNARSSGDGGQVSVSAPTVHLDNGRIQAQTTGTGNAGTVDVHGALVMLTGGAEINSRSTARGNAGNVTITAETMSLSTQSRVTTEALQADGGNVTVTAQNMVRLRDSQITTAVGSGAGTGGNISIDPKFVLLENSQIVANAFQGKGGNIQIQAQQVFLADPASIVSASSALGINGQVNIQAPVTSISGAVAPLPQAFAQDVELLRSRCAERLREGTVSRFVVGGRDGVPLEPGSLLLSPLQRVGPQGEVQGDERESHNPEAQQEHARYVQAPVPGSLEVECAKWRSQPETAATLKRLR